MNLFVDGRIFTFQKKGGISRIFLEILPLMSTADKSLETTLLVQGCGRDILPQHERIVIAPKKEWPVPENMLGKLLLKIQRTLYLASLSMKTSRIWYSSYYTLPSKWNGPVVMLVADLIHELYPELFMSLQNDEFRRRKAKCINQADAIICISEATRKDLINFYRIDRKKTHVALLAYSEIFRPLQEARQQYPQTTDKPFFLYVGTRVHYKNYDFFIRSYATWGQGKDVDIVLVGAPLNKQEKDVLSILGIEDQVHVLSEIDDQRLCVLYNQALAFVYPSLYEGFGIPLLEAMACGCPVIASDIPSSREIAADVPFYFTLEDENSLRACFESVKDNDLKATVKQKGMLHAREYAWEKTAGKTLDILTRSMKDWEMN